MKKTISIMTISLLTATTLATASPSDQMDFTTLNQSDSHMLFGETNHNSIALGQDEMMNTEGEWGWFIPLILGWGTSVANAPTSNYDRTYSGSIPSYTFQSWWW